MASLEKCVEQALCAYEQVDADSECLDEELYAAGQKASQRLQSMDCDDSARRTQEALQRGLNSFIPAMFAYKHQRRHIEGAHYHAGDAVALIGAPAIMALFAQCADIGRWTGMVAFGAGTAAVTASILYLGRKMSIIGNRQEHLQNLYNEYAATRRALIDSVVTAAKRV